MRLNAKNSFLLGYLCVMFIFWGGIQASHITNLQINLWWGLGINCIPTFGGIFGLHTARKWGGMKSALGRAITFLSLGLLAWAFGNWLWSYYNFFLKTEVPYPSLADVGYVIAVPLWITGIYYLSIATGAKFSVRKLGGRIYLFLLPILATAFSYYTLFVIARGGSFDWADNNALKIIFDLAYPIGDWLILTLAFLVWGLSLKYLGGRYKWPIFITLYGYVLMFIADFTFSYTTTLNTYYNGSISDLFFVLAMFVISFGIASIDGKEE